MACTVNKKIILASGSPRRKELLESLGWSFDVIVSNIDEELLAGEAPPDMVKRLAIEKARAVAVNFPDAYVIGSDTSVVIEKKVLGKPENKKESIEMLKLLNGRTHYVYSGVALCFGDNVFSDFDCTEVTFRYLNEEALFAYVESGEGLDKAGSYAIQGLGSLLVESIRGCYFNVVGLPLYSLSCLFEKAGISLADQWRMRS
ncbi:MAG: Maf family protein [Aminobacterium sp.]|uniref:Maf family protein n=1 Tax=Aminobacterium sp. TaxID=1872491 RepID=UPI001BCF00D3|nr:Maf family nucleotide pyrophosphatase [Aminobacterium sp.]MDD2206218.1 Maf family protein [Aminobacterium sp.]MDD4551215.1 Maf family protein [Aminobacterium sp.]MEA4876477.1 Maf family protein [Aminobacterium sp.]